jgi:hypothetical protein
MLLLEQNDEWLVGRRYLSESSLALVLTDRNEPATVPDYQQIPSSPLPEHPGPQ